ncbi:MAG: tryptophan-rich sensory protein [Labilithrix sp.]|nr:tryptophan-rich sensory protein [Labilithrix sp.]
MRANDSSALGGLATFGATTIAYLFSSHFAERRKGKLWYRLLRKPPQTPPSWLFKAIWPVLYGLTAYSGYRVWKKRHSHDAKSALALWASQLAFNAAWTPLFFGRHRSRAALADLALNLATLIAYTARAARVDRLAALLMTPYLAWLAFAGTLNAGIVRRNPRLLAG